MVKSPRLADPAMSANPLPPPADTGKTVDAAQLPVGEDSLDFSLLSSISKIMLQFQQGEAKEAQDATMMAYEAKCEEQVAERAQARRVEFSTMYHQGLHDAYGAYQERAEEVEARAE